MVNLRSNHAVSSARWRIDTRVKWIICIAFIVHLNLLPWGSWIPMTLIGVLLFTWGVAQGANMRRIPFMAGVVVPFTLSSASLLFTTVGTPIGQLPITQEGLIRFVTVILRAWLATQSFLILVNSNNFQVLIQALAQMGLPQSFVVTLQFTYRYLFVLQDEANRLLRARASRSASPTQRQPAWWWQIQVTAGMIGTLFIRSLERAERIYIAMSARGFTGQLLYTPALPWTNQDKLALIGCNVLLLCIQFIAQR